LCGAVQARVIDEERVRLGHGGEIAQVLPYNSLSAEAVFSAWNALEHGEQLTWRILACHAFPQSCINAIGSELMSSKYKRVMPADIISDR
jgi:hypothetical protein